MENKAVCRKISSMLSLYIDNQLSYQERVLVEEHLSECPECRAKLLYLQTLIKDLKSSYKLVLDATKKKQEQRLFSIREHEKFLSQLYPYVDNELDEAECEVFQNYVTKSENAQRKLKNLYKIQKELKTSYDKVKTSLGSDFSQKIVKELKLYDKNYKAENNKFVQMLFSSKSVKVAILFGLVVFGGYEVEMYFKHYNQNQPSSVRQEKTIEKKAVKNETASIIGY